MNCPLPTLKPPVDMVEVAEVEVALKFPKVGVDVAVMTPFAFVERSELMAVEVAVMLPPTKRVPEKYPLPLTERVVLGVVEEMPTYPVPLTRR